MKTVHFLLSMLVVLTAFTGCSNSKKMSTTVDTPAVLYQQQWNLIALMGEAVPAISTASLLFSDGAEKSVTGSTGCNRFTGKVAINADNTIKFLPLATTKMACLNPGISTVESTFLHALTQADQWHIRDKALQLTHQGKVVALFNAAKTRTEQEMRLNGTWELNYIAGTEKGLSELFPQKKPTLIFNLPDSLVRGNRGCNGFGSKVRIAGNTISFGDPLSTMMACEGNGEPVFFKTLKMITAYSVNDDNTLTLVKGDIAVMRFERK